jgi:hypothetical protein
LILKGFLEFLAQRGTVQDDRLVERRRIEIDLGSRMVALFVMAAGGRLLR